MPLVVIDSASDPRVADYMQVREAELRKDRYDAPGGLFVAEGELVVRRLLASRYRTRSMLITRARLNTLQDLVSRLDPEIPVYLVDQPTMNSVVGFNIHRGVLAIGERGPEPALPGLLAASRFLIILEDLTNHDNVGGIFRNVAGLGAGCFGESAVLLSPKCADPLYRKSIRVSMGAALQVPFGWILNWPGHLGIVRDAGYTIVAMSLADDSVDIDDFSVQIDHKSTKIAILLGSEGPGLTPEASAAADVRVRIPMPGRTPQASSSPAGQVSNHAQETNSGVDSLNVSVACAIALHRFFPRFEPNRDNSVRDAIDTGARAIQ